MPDEEFVISHGDLLDIVIDWILDEAAITDFGDYHVGDVHVDDLPPQVEEQLESMATDARIREALEKRMSEARAAGRAFPIPTARELSAARERALARRRKSE